MLSACDTGGGPVQSGEGVLGLQRAFRIAGAATVVMSLWKVDDESTRRWMTELYRHRLAGTATVDAVRAASRAVVTAKREAELGSHPFHWGAFVATGSWR